MLMDNTERKEMSEEKERDRERENNRTNKKQVHVLGTERLLLFHSEIWMRLPQVYLTTLNPTVLFWYTQIHTYTRPLRFSFYLVSVRKMSRVKRKGGKRGSAVQGQRKRRKDGGEVCFRCICVWSTDWETEVRLCGYCDINDFRIFDVCYETN
ncbi:hypothetical protein M0804_008925 [Polistes exclamans]|nr:hypothetical protein M0804_008925 [Polistes exclamans]